MPNIYAPSNDYIGPVKKALASIVTTQIPAILPAQVYPDMPNGAPPSGSVVFILNKFSPNTETNGKIRLDFIINCLYLTMVRDDAQDVQECESYLMPFLQAFSDDENTTLGGLAYLMDPQPGGITLWEYGAQQYRALVVPVKVFTEYNIPV